MRVRDRTVFALLAVCASVMIVVAALLVLELAEMRLPDEIILPESNAVFQLRQPRLIQETVTVGAPVDYSSGALKAPDGAEGVALRDMPLSDREDVHSYPPDAVGVVTEVRGAAFVGRQDTRPVPLKYREYIRKGDMLETGRNSALQVALAGGGMLRVGEEVTLVVQARADAGQGPVPLSESAAVIRLERGVGRVSAAVGAGRFRHRHVVGSGMASVEFVCGDVAIESRPDRTDVYALDLPAGGTVTIETKTGGDAGQSTQTVVAEPLCAVSVKRDGNIERRPMRLAEWRRLVGEECGLPAARYILAGNQPHETEFHFAPD